jgi:hypothetical protein
MTFKQCAESYIKAHRSGWRNAKHAAQWEATLATYAEPIVGALPVQAIDTALVMKVLEQDVGDESGAVARPPEQAVAGSFQGTEGRTSCGATLRRTSHFHERAAAARGRCRSRVGVRHPDRGADERSYGRPMG